MLRGPFDRQPHAALDRRRRSSGSFKLSRPLQKNGSRTKVRHKARHWRITPSSRIGPLLLIVTAVAGIFFGGGNVRSHSEDAGYSTDPTKGEAK